MDADLGERQPHAASGDLLHLEIRRQQIAYRFTVELLTLDCGQPLPPVLKTAAIGNGQKEMSSGFQHTGDLPNCGSRSIKVLE